MVDYHIMNNKRFVLTKDNAKTVQLWQADTCEMVNEYTQDFEHVKKTLEAYDLKHSKETPLP
jgi:hypothetical protein